MPKTKDRPKCKSCSRPLQLVQLGPNTWTWCEKCDRPPQK